MYSIQSSSLEHRCLSKRTLQQFSISERSSGLIEEFYDSDQDSTSQSNRVQSKKESSLRFSPCSNGMSNLVNQIIIHWAKDSNLKSLFLSFPLIDSNSIIKHTCSIQEFHYVSIFAIGWPTVILYCKFTSTWDHISKWPEQSQRTRIESLIEEIQKYSSTCKAGKHSGPIFQRNGGLQGFLQRHGLPSYTTWW